MGAPFRRPENAPGLPSASTVSRRPRIQPLTGTDGETHGPLSQGLEGLVPKRRICRRGSCSVSFFSSTFRILRRLPLASGGFVFKRFAYTARGLSSVVVYFRESQFRVP